MNFKNNIISKIKIIISLIFSLIFIACGGNKNQNKSYAEDNLKTVTKQTNEPVLEDESPKSQINENITIDKNLKSELLDNFFQHYKNTEFLFSLNKN